MNSPKDMLALLDDITAEASTQSIIENMTDKEMRTALLSIQQKTNELKNETLNTAKEIWLMNMADNYIQLRDHINEVING